MSMTKEKLEKPTVDEMFRRQWVGTESVGYPEMYDGQKQEDHATARNPKLKEND